MTFHHPVDGEFEPKLNGEHTSHVWAPLDDPPRPLHPGVEATLRQDHAGADSAFSESAHHRDASGEFASAGEGEVSGSSTSARERSDWSGRGGRTGATPGSNETTSGWTAGELADLADEKPEGVEAADAAKEAEHTATVKFNGDFDMAGLLKHLHHLGAVGASRSVNAIDADDKPVPFGWDGDGADKIVEAEVDGKDVLAQDDYLMPTGEPGEVAIDHGHDGPWMSCMRRDGKLMYQNKNLPSEVDIGGKPVNVADVLLKHEVPEYAELEKLLAEFKEKNGCEPDAAEREAVYLKAHKSKGTPSEKAYCEEKGIDWPKWSAWCRGIEAELEKGPFTNEPDDADVKPIPHGHGDLEAEDAAAWDAAVDIATDWTLRMALDRDSVRTIDHDGRLHIEVANICKANICPYKGEEIPGWEELGLDPERIYQLLRAPEELEKALPTANSLQILKKHVPVNADDHQPWETVGATGSTATWANPCIQNTLVIWAKDAIDDIESEAKRELSPGYHYEPDMTQGSYQGEHYDGVMREIKFNHLALVETGRQGSDVVIGDGTEELLWTIAERAILEHLRAP